MALWRKRRMKLALNTLNFALGGKSRIPGDSPLELPWTVEALHEGNFATTGPFYRGMKMRSAVRLPALSGRASSLLYLQDATGRSGNVSLRGYRADRAGDSGQQTQCTSADFTPVRITDSGGQAPGPMAETRRICRGGPCRVAFMLIHSANRLHGCLVCWPTFDRGHAGRQRSRLDFLRFELFLFCPEDC